MKNCENCKYKLEADWRVCPMCGSTAQPDVAKAPSKPTYGSGVRAQVFEVIVRQAIAGAPWRKICAGPMQVNSIDPEEVEEEIRRRRGGGGTGSSPSSGPSSGPGSSPSSGSSSGPVPKKPHPTQGAGGIVLELPTPSKELLKVRESVQNLIKNNGLDHSDLQTKLSKILSELDSLANIIQDQEQALHRSNSEAQLQQDLEREYHRIKQEIKPPGWTPPHHI